MKSSHPTRDPQGQHTSLYMLIFFFMETIIFWQSSRCRVDMCFETSLSIGVLQHSATGNTLQYTALHCNALQHTATHCNTQQHTATHCSTLQHTAAQCNALQHTSSHCNTLQRTATHCKTRSCTKQHRKRGFFHQETQQCRQTTNDSHTIRDPQETH